jgi:twitching motility protein PilT
MELAKQLLNIPRVAKVDVIVRPHHPDLDTLLSFADRPKTINELAPYAMILEVLVPNAAVRNLIREDKIHQIYSAMQSGQDKFGMQTFNQALATAYFQKQITMETALIRSSNPDELQEMVNRGASLTNRTATGTAAGATKR